MPFLERHLAAGKAGCIRAWAGSWPGASRAAGNGFRNIRLEQRSAAIGRRVSGVRRFSRRRNGCGIQAKALEVVAAFLYQPAAGEELFCQRQHHLNRERVQKVLAILKENLAEPPGLEELGRRVGCSHFYFSRIFTQEVGKTISVTLRDLRMERAASLLREGRMNVTQVALEVGYSSLSHFSSAFHEVIGCCPGLYPLAPGAGAKDR